MAYKTHGKRLVGFACAKLSYDYGWNVPKPDEKYVTEVNEKTNIVIDQVPKRANRKTPKYPIVLCHGLSGFDKLFLIPSFTQIRALISQEQLAQEQLDADQTGLFLEYWRGIQKALVAEGCVVLIAKVPPMGSIEERAIALNKFITGQIENVKNNEVLEQKVYDNLHQGDREPVKINLIAHSMGGLDCRYLVSQLHQSNYQVVSLTTVSSPHRGSEIADYIVDLVSSWSPDTPESVKESETYYAKFLPPSIYELTTYYMREFNKKILNDKNVEYFSYGARFVPQWYNLYRFTWWKIYQQAGDNDGLISIKSAKWGKYMGTIDNADHLDLINWKNSLKLLWLETMYHQKDKFNAIDLYLNIADDLANQGL